MKEREAQYEPLRGEQDGSGGDYDWHRKLQNERRRRQWLTALSAIELIAILILAYLVFQAHSLSSSSDDQGTGRHGGFPPATASLRYGRRLFDKYGVNTSPTAQAPGPALDAAWHDLLSSMMIRVSPAELKSQTAEMSIPLANGTGYVASLGVYHELHCIKLLKHWLHKDHYLAGWEDHKVDQYWKHLNHCLDWLKEAALCHGDTTLTTLAWNGTILDTEYPVAYRCVEPESLFEWADARAVDVSNVNVLIPPS